MRKPIFLILIAVLALLLLAARTFAPDIVIDWWSIGPSGAVLTQGSVELQGAIGQGVAGDVSLADTRVCSGYLCFGPFLDFWLYLPAIRK